MPFTALRFDTDDADAWSDALLHAGALSVDASDPFAGTPREQPLYDEPGEAPGAWQLTRLVALFPGEAEARDALRLAAGALGRSPPAHETSAVDDEDWVRATQAQFGPIVIDDRLHIVPTWCELPPAGIVVRLDPGLAFGTGSHATTRLCLQWLLAQDLAGRSMLDYGCGSGLLAIAAAKLGAAGVWGTDIDAQALVACAANARANGVDVDVALPDALPSHPFDVVAANILANPLTLLAPALAARVVIGGRLALSGILDSQAGAVVIAYARWFKLAATRSSDGWTLVSLERSDA